MSRLVVNSFVAAAIGCWSVTAAAQTNDRLDTSRTVTLTGAIKGVFMPMAGSSFLVVDTKDEAGATRSWAVQGDPMNALMQSGWKPKVPLGQMVTVKAFALKANVKAVDVVGPTAPAAVIAAANEGRLLQGIEVTFPNGTTLPFGASK
jgi:hypothetical protein